MSELLQEENTYPAKSSGPLSAFIDDPVNAFPSIVRAVPHQRLSWSVAGDAGVTLYLRRDDAIHPLLSGNKLYKLWGHYCAYKASAHMFAGIVSFGGAFSNHLHALAALGQLAGVTTTGIIRGERPHHPSQTLLDLQAMGMRLVFISRAEYKQYTRLDAEMLATSELAKRCGLVAHMWVAEGGAGAAGRQGCAYLGRMLAASPHNVIVHACGTGTSLAGLAEGLLGAEQLPRKQLLGIAALKGGNGAVQLIRQSMKAQHGRLNMGSEQRAIARHAGLDIALSNQYHCGGFAKFPAYLVNFKQLFEAETGVVLDKVYTTKLFWGLQSMIRRGMFAEGTSILAVHSGGLQGNRQV